MSLVSKATTKSTDNLKIVENVFHNADKMNLMCVSISIGRTGKQNKILCECIDKWWDKCVKNISTVCFTNTVCYSRYHISKESKKWNREEKHGLKKEDIR